MSDLKRPWWVYCLSCGDGTLYIGVTTDVSRRLAQHRRGRGARYTRGRGPVTLLGVEGPFDRGQALARERWWKRKPRAVKLRHWAGGATL